MKTRIGLVVLVGGLFMVAACREQAVRRDAPPAPAAQPATTAPIASATAAAAPVASVAAVPTAAAKTGTAEAKPVVPGATKLSVKRLVLSRDVKGREPIGAQDAFIDGEQTRIYAFVEVDNPERLAGEIFVSFVPPKGRDAGGDIKLPVGAERRWRTWAFTRTAHRSGEWTAVVKNARGEVLAERAFTVTKDPYPS